MQSVRDDYCEFTELLLVFLSATEAEVSFCHPGAVHETQGVAKVICSLRTALVENSIEQLPLGQQSPAITRWQWFSSVTFVTDVYLMWWNSCQQGWQWDGMSYKHFLSQIENILPVSSFLRNAIQVCYSANMDHNACKCTIMGA